jgi:hypothetical protein
MEEHQVAVAGMTGCVAGDQPAAGSIAAPLYKRRRVAGAALLTVLLMLLAAAPSAFACPAVQFLGVRGSGEGPSGFGGTVGPVLATVNHGLSYVNVGNWSEPSSYPAITVNPADPSYLSDYIKSVKAGVAGLHNEVAYFRGHESCGDTPLLVAGYSQGAEIVDDWLDNAFPKEDNGNYSYNGANIVGVALLGDPRYYAGNPENVVNNHSTKGVVATNNSVNGVAPYQFSSWEPPWSSPPSPFGSWVLYPLAAYSSSLRSFCAHGDPVCGSSENLAELATCGTILGVGHNDCAHLHYMSMYISPGQTYTTAAGLWLVQRYQAHSASHSGTGSGTTGGGTTSSGGGTTSSGGGTTSSGGGTTSSGGGTTSSGGSSGGGPTAGGGVPSGSIAETAGGTVNTWTNYSDAGGTEGAQILKGATVGVSCKLHGLAVQDGNTWWYLIASSPWSGQFYASADAFYNNGATSGSLAASAFVDPAVPNCSGTAGSSQPPSGSGTVSETTGGVTHTWTNYSDAGGTEGSSIPANDTVQVACRIQGFAVADGDTWWYQIASSPWSNAYYASADAFYNSGATSGSLIGTPFVDTNVSVCGGSSTGSGGGGSGTTATFAETVGGVTHTWTNYSNAGGTEGPSIPSNETVQIVCKVTGFKVADGDTWWYQIASSPWSGTYYASADAFYNNGATSGSLIGTPFVDSSVPNCGTSGGGGGGGSTPPPTYPETVGGVTHTWTNYSNAGGNQGPSIQTGTTVQIACKVTGFKVADGDTWWYKVASSPWNGTYYASADAFYNNGATSGSLIGTPFVDPNVPNC